MDYRTLTDADHAELAQQKLRAIEVEHARVALDLRIAAKVGVTEGDQVAHLRASLTSLDLQHAETLAELEPPPAEEPPRAADNGSVSTREPLATRR